jgi:septation ring formation regulator EzrA
MLYLLADNEGLNGTDAEYVMQKLEKNLVEGQEKTDNQLDKIYQEQERNMQKIMRAIEEIKNNQEQIKNALIHIYSQGLGGDIPRLKNKSYAQHKENYPRLKDKPYAQHIQEDTKADQQMPR